jgi:xanthine dehydrogenase FAD-binding subunit
MSLWQQYFQPKTLTETIDALANAPGLALPLAGGTDLLLDLEAGRHAPIHTLVDITSVRELLPLEIRGEELFIGAGVSVSSIITSDLVNTHASALVEACELIGGPQVRNAATLGGNVAHALPAADGTIALLALRAEAEIASSSGNRRTPFGDLFLGPGKSALKHGKELLVGFYLPLRKPGEGSCFNRIMRPQGVALPIVNVAIWLACKLDTIGQICIAVGPGGPTPWRAIEAEKVLLNQTLTEGSIAAALEALLAHAGFRTSPHRASVDYRRHLVGILLSDTLQAAWQRAS